MGISYYADKYSYYDYTNKSYMVNKLGLMRNHGVMVVGWDDDYSYESYFCWHIIHTLCLSFM